MVRELYTYLASLNLSKTPLKHGEEGRAEKPAVVKKVAATMTVGKLKAMTHRLFKAKGGPRKLSLTYQSAEEQSAGNPGVELTEWDSDLQYYSVTNGGRVTARSG